jgi:hypothetical protein
MFKKTKLLRLECVYTANVFSFDGHLQVAAGSEREFPSHLINLDTQTVTKIASGPGGTMSLVPVPGSKDHLVSVMGLFPPFISNGAGIYLHSKSEGNWSAGKVLELPFAHRCEFQTIGNVNYLFAASCSKHKANPEDWSNAGELFVVALDNAGNSDWKPILLLDNLVRNHGMGKAIINGVESLCVSGAEGIFAVEHDQETGFKVVRIFPNEVSEFVYIDLDGDGIDELVTIEPFHGNTLNIYKQKSGEWAPCYSSPLSFGHGLSAGSFKGDSVIVVGNRRDSEALELHKVVDLAKGQIEMTEIERNVGPTQTKLFHHHGTDYILSANQVKNEVVIYS